MHSEGRERNWNSTEHITMTGDSEHGALPGIANGSRSIFIKVTKARVVLHFSKVKKCNFIPVQSDHSQAVVTPS